MADTDIEWATKVWNIVRGCRRVSKGCLNCYAERMAHRFSGIGKPYQGLTVLTEDGPRWTGEARFIPEMLAEPLRWRKPERIFVNSMSDLFHEAITDEEIAAIFGVMAACPQHQFLILTKRPKRMKQWFDVDVNICEETISRLNQIGYETGCGSAFDPDEWPLKNVWLGVSCEDQDAANERIPLLLQTPASIRWISAEPLLGNINLEIACCKCPWPEDAIKTRHNLDCPCARYPLPRNIPLDWVVAGGESGPGARAMHPDWARSLRNQCAKNNVKYFFKQWGQYAAISGCDDPCGKCVIALPNGSITNNKWEAGPHLKGGIQMHRVGKKNSGRLLDGVEWNEFPSVK